MIPTKEDKAPKMFATSKGGMGIPQVKDPPKPESMPMHASFHQHC